MRCSLHALNRRVRCRPAARCVDLLTDGMVDFVCVLNLGSAVQNKLHAQFLRLFSLHDDVNDAHRAGANRLQNKKTHVEQEGLPPMQKD